VGFAKDAPQVVQKYWMACEKSKRQEFKNEVNYQCKCQVKKEESSEEIC
jgi:hypothetical protein